MTDKERQPPREPPSPPPLPRALRRPAPLPAQPRVSAAVEERPAAAVIATAAGLVLLILLLMLGAALVRGCAATGGDGFTGASGDGGGAGGGSGGGRGPARGDDSGDQPPAESGGAAPGQTGAGAGSTTDRPPAASSGAGGGDSGEKPPEISIAISEETSDGGDGGTEQQSAAAPGEETSGPGGNGTGQGGGGGGAEFFGSRAGGRKFVYIVDCSGSMDGPPFAKACGELKHSIEKLDDKQRYFVIFFSDDALPQPEGKLVYATAANKDRLKTWVDALQANGNTFPQNAFLLGLSQNPDAMFFLTDGVIDPTVVEAVRQANTRRVTINTVAFGNPVAEPLLRQIAVDSGGEYRFIP